jgi:phosphinothricin acetyltransferase
VSGILIRVAEEGDLPDLVDLYNHYIRETAITFDTEPYTVAARRPWFAGFGKTGRYRLMVAEQDGRVVGYASSTVFRTKAAYDPSVETSIYLAPDLTGNGLGARLYAALFDALRTEDIHRAYAGITLPNAASIAIHERFGFVYTGTFSEAGRKFGRYWDVAWYEKRFDG